eukprot:CAMPEP_0203692606 /NCGR_PEP_ID=MMETSP0091-20130426/4746_1 /ASSEMBLY_ACC=CAM_ASM_001089 /TAXON_ID=426623 /ORGANISM="Chaetoceros affinis, Strain CCMP159" /LENGTH=373 /DNA_ID=CAMNT_0050563483 /DNA_START=1 /DNA_END=1122 /DNA_ORIENTATION=-
MSLHLQLKLVVLINLGVSATTFTSALSPSLSQNIVAFANTARSSRIHTNTYTYRHHKVWPSSSSSSSSQLHMNFFKDLIDSAFENDPNLSTNKSQQQIDGPNDDEGTNIFALNNDNGKTEVQKRWLESQSQSQTKTTSSSSSFTSPTNAKGAPINPALLPGTKWIIQFYLTGIPDFDPSNSLYGSKVNISTRKDSSMAKDGFAIGADTLPKEPSTTCTVEFCDGGICLVSDGSFTVPSESKSEGEGESVTCKWILSDDYRMIRFSFLCRGYQRTVTTTGTIQNVYWSDQDEVRRKSSATYSIPSGIIYAEASIGYGSTPGTLVMANAAAGAMAMEKSAPAGLLKVEQKMGVLGLSSKMVSCGKFSAQMVDDDS